MSELQAKVGEIVLAKLKMLHYGTTIEPSPEEPVADPTEEEEINA